MVEIWSGNHKTAGLNLHGIIIYLSPPVCPRALHPKAGLSLWFNMVLFGDKVMEINSTDPVMGQ